MYCISDLDKKWTVYNYKKLKELTVTGFLTTDVMVNVSKMQLIFYLHFSIDLIVCLDTISVMMNNMTQELNSNE